MLNIYTGKHQDDLKRFLFGKIEASLKAIQDGTSAAERVLLIVPAQFTLDAERTAFEQLGGHGFFDLQIMSGNKFKADILKETGGPGRASVDRLGRSMLLRSIAAEKAPQFKAFSAAAAMPEFCSMAGDMIVSLEQHRISPELIENLAQDPNCDTILSDKLSDIFLVYKEYEQIMKDKYTDSENRLALTASQVPFSHLAKSSEIWYYDFYSFSKNEAAFLSALAENCAGFNMMLLVPEDEDKAAASLNTIKMLRTQIPENKITAVPSSEQAKTPEVRIIRCASPYTQAETIAAEVLELLRTGTKADEIAILTGENAQYSQAVKRIFARLSIPLFMDEKRSIIHIPFASALSSLLEICSEGLKQGAVLSLLKNGLITPSLGLDEPDTDEFENYVKQYHINKNKFTKPFRYGLQSFGQEAFERAEDIRSALCKVLLPFLEAFSGSKTFREKTAVLYSFLTDTLDAPALLAAEEAKLSMAGQADAAEETGQIFGVIMGLLDQGVELIGDKEISDQDYAELLIQSFTDIKVGLLPQSEGCVTLGTVSRSKLHNIKALFIAGANDGQIPADPRSSGLLTDDEIEALCSYGYELAKPGRILSDEEALNIYKAVDAPSEFLWLGWCMSDSSGESLRASSLIEEFTAKGCKEEADIENAGEWEAFTASGIFASEKLTSQLRDFLAGRSSTVPPQWQQVFNYLREQQSERLDNIKKGILFTNKEENLSKESLSALFGKDGGFSYSPSRLENYAACPFRHFVRYGLRPDEQKEMEIGGAEIGNIYHFALKALSDRLNAETSKAGLTVTAPGSPWMAVTKEEVETFLNDILADINLNSMEGIMDSGDEERYRAKRISSSCTAFCWQMIQQLRCGNVDEMYFEASFGKGKGSFIEPITIETEAGEVRIEGKIDRVDISGPYVKIIDYKSGSRKFDIKETSGGFSLQLMIYLESALTRYKDSKPAGVFYYRIEDAGEEVSLPQIAADEISEDIKKLLEKKYMLDGLFVNDPDVISTIDKAFLSTGESDVIKIQKGKDGTLKSNSALLPEAFDAFREEFSEKLTETVKRLNSGDLSIDPHSVGNRSVCTYCKYNSICMFSIRA